MIENALADCYGIIVDCDFKEKFEALLSEDEDLEDWELDNISNTYCPYLNTWTSTDCFFGIIKYFDEEIHEVNNSFPSEDDFKQFIKLCKKYNLYNLLNTVKWEPKKYIITFVF